MSFSGVNGSHEIQMYFETRKINKIKKINYPSGIVTFLISSIPFLKKSCPTIKFLEDRIQAFYLSFF